MPRSSREVFAPPLPLSHGADLYVSPTGTPSGAGTLGSYPILQVDGGGLPS